MICTNIFIIVKTDEKKKTILIEDILLIMLHVMRKTVIVTGRQIGDFLIDPSFINHLSCLNL